MSQERLNHYMLTSNLLLSIQKEKTDEINLKMAPMDFVKRMKRENVPLVFFVIQRDFL